MENDVWQEPDSIGGEQAVNEIEVGPTEWSQAAAEAPPVAAAFMLTAYPASNPTPTDSIPQPVAAYFM
jgi:hypothetical protein